MPPIDPALLLLRPRQVALLANSAMGKQPKSPNLTSDQKALLVRSVARFLQSNGFSKTLKKFLSEAHVTRSDDLSGNVELEEIFSKHINNACDNGKAQQPTHPTEQDTKVLNGKSKKSEKQPEEPGKNEKQKTKKKKKDASSEPESVHDSTVVEKPKDVNVEEKIKKKKKNDSKKDTILNGSVTTVDSKILELETMADDSKKSKKRKRTGSDENELKPAKKIEVEESLGSLKNNEKVQQCDDLENGNVDKSAEKLGTQKSAKKQGKGSAEPKTAFQRVKVEEVVFTDDRLKNNSYWAKGGAETGYGAKAEEVLGQVRGRDFRHEKTKKKRGSYRGGLIDLQSHSVKFNYSDEE